MTKHHFHVLFDFQMILFALNESEAIQQCIDLAVEATHSEIGYVHFVNDDQETIELVTWSTSTLAICSAVYERHYPISEAGVWADSARFKRYFIHNDYQALNVN